MSFLAFGCAEHGDNLDIGLRWSQNPAGSAAIVSSPALAGTYSYSVSPTAADGLGRYGLYVPSMPNPEVFSVLFLWQFAVGFDAVVSVSEAGLTGGGGALARRLVLSTDESLQLQDEDEDQIGATAGSYVAINTLYAMLWFVDLRSPTRDILWVYPPGGPWAKAIDVTGWGAGSPANISAICFGSQAGKTAPTSGGPMYYDNMAVQQHGVSPLTTPLGSIACRVKMPNGAGTYNAFDSGSPSYLDVDEIPYDGDTTYDEGDAAGEQQSYAIAAADTSESPLAVQIVGAAKATNVFAAYPTATPFLYDGAAIDYGDIRTPIDYRGLGSDTTWQSVNSAPLTESLFNNLEAGLEVITCAAGQTARLSQIGLEYMVPGNFALPSDFPTLTFANRRRLLAQII